MFDFNQMPDTKWRHNQEPENTISQSATHNTITKNEKKKKKNCSTNLKKRVG